MPTPAVLSLGSNVGDRNYHLRTALYRVGRIMRLVRISSVWETDPVDCPRGASPFLNLVCAGTTTMTAHELLDEMQSIEKRMGRLRTVRNAPRQIDIDLIFYGGMRLRTSSLVVPHPRYSEREFVLSPLRELNLGWFDTLAGLPVDALRGSGAVRKATP